MLSSPPGPSHGGVFGPYVTPRSFEHGWCRSPRTGEGCSPPSSRESGRRQRARRRWVRRRGRRTGPTPAPATEHPRRPQETRPPSSFPRRVRETHADEPSEKDADNRIPHGGRFERSLRRRGRGHELGAPSRQGRVDLHPQLAVAHANVLLRQNDRRAAGGNRREQIQKRGSRRSQRSHDGAVVERQRIRRNADSILSCRCGESPAKGPSGPSPSAE